MSKMLVSLIGSVLLAAPAFAFAQAIPVGPTLIQLATRTSAIEAQITALQSGKSLACAAFLSPAHISVGQQAILSWGSVGSVAQSTDPQNMWPQNGAILLMISKPGTWTYPFTFYDASGNSVSCKASIVVTA